MSLKSEGSSKYRDAAPVKVAGAWRRNVAIINVVAISILVIVSLGYIFAQDAPGYLFWVLLVADVCILYTQWVLKTRNTAEVMKIISHDCDPDKLIKVIDMIEPALHNKTDRQSFHSIYAVCCSQMGYDDIALEWASHLEAENPRNARIRFTVASVRTAVAKHRNDAGTLQAMRSLVAAISAGAGRDIELTNAADALIAAIDRKLALMAGNYAQVRELNDVIARYAVNPQAKLSNEYDRAELEDALGNTAAAWQHYSRVAEQGGTLAIRGLAESWLAAHSLSQGSEGAAI